VKDLDQQRMFSNQGADVDLQLWVSLFRYRAYGVDIAIFSGVSARGEKQKREHNRGG
jgi:hypothetical protein